MREPANVAGARNAAPSSEKDRERSISATERQMKEMAGKGTNNPKLRAKGVAEKTAGQVQEKRSGG